MKTCQAIISESFDIEKYLKCHVLLSSTKAKPALPTWTVIINVSD